MKKLTSFVISSLLVFGAVACENGAKTSGSAPDNPSVAPTETPNAQATQAAQKDAQSDLRRKQVNEDIRAHEQRNDQFNSGSNANRSEGALAREVGDKLEANIPGSHLKVDAKKDGTVTVGGTVPHQDQVAKIPTLAKQIKGVKNVVVNAKVGQGK